MTTILGISAFYPDSVAALMVDGNTLAVPHAERFTRKQHDAGVLANTTSYRPEPGGPHRLSKLFMRPPPFIHTSFRS